MNQYELAVLYDPRLEIDLSKAEASVGQIIKEAKGSITKTDNWGKRKLAYKIAKHEHAIYVIYEVDIPAENLTNVEKTLNITDEVIRFLITKPDLKAIARAKAIEVKRASRRQSEQDTQDDEK